MKKKITKEYLERRMFGFSAASELVLELYETNNGYPDGNPIECPLCDRKTLYYSCHWFGNKHVHLHCENCKWTAMQ